jgi:hypothetical protein
MGYDRERAEKRFQRKKKYERKDKEYGDKLTHRSKSSFKKKQHQIDEDSGYSRKLKEYDDEEY